jgi:putative acetyltransferase
VSIRPEAPEDLEAIRTVIASAFGRPDEADLVDRLRTDGDLLLSLVSTDRSDVIGHIAFSRLPVGDAAAAALAPVAVAPDRQGQGIGAALIREGIHGCRKLGLAGVVVLGHPEYYPRFGFTAEAAQAISAPFSGPAFMALSFGPPLKGAARYARAFS